MKLKMGHKSLILWAKKIIICTLSLILLGIGCGINLATNQGADPITVFYDGLHNISNITSGQVATILNASLILLVLIFDFLDARKKANREGKKLTFFDVFNHIHIGTIIYLFVLGAFIDFGEWAYGLLHVPDMMMGMFNVSQIIASLIGCVFCFIGLGGFMAVAIGIDPWTAAAVILSDKMKKPFGPVKITLDALTLLFGWLMGGVVGIITLFCAFLGGPIIQKSAEILDKTFKKMLKSD
ncbi:MAG: hypothetical protein Q4D57_01800 [Clostridia bacterium]|nr:hypothetical protein [Clostridia bacterium]